MEVDATGAGPSRPMTQLDSVQEPLRNLVAWWLLGLLNNAAYVIMIAGANQISAAAVGLVYFCAVAPAILCKATGPYWFHLVAYRHRMATVAALMACSYTTVALTTHRGWQLLGVVFASLQGGLGEASCLALTSYYTGQPVITAWSSGTGFAGVAGYAWVASLHVLGGLSFKATLLLANATPAIFLATYYLILLPPKRQLYSGGGLLGGAQLRQHGRGPHDKAQNSSYAAAAGRAGGAAGTAGVRREGEVSSSWQDGDEGREPGEWQRLLTGSLRGAKTLGNALTGSAASAPLHEVPLSHYDSPWGQHDAAEGTDHNAGDDSGSEDGKAPKACHMTWRERAQRTVALWPYMVPLTVVYFAEYAMQSGTWTAIGFPVTDAEARRRFYIYSNWCYQAGVFISRSSGMVYQATRMELWFMPSLQLLFLFFFLLDAVHKFWYNWGLLVPCVITGLLGGAVYVNAFTLISNEVDPQYKEFSLGAASLADSLGVAMADISGILIQGCLFKANGLDGADFKC